MDINEVEVEEGIKHLDFPFEEEKEEPPETKHYLHPIDIDKWWCGKPRPAGSERPGLSNERTPASEITCVDCLHLYIAKGGDWWWQVNKAWYGEGPQPT